jgi:hypothetical protein
MSSSKELTHYLIYTSTEEFLMQYLMMDIHQRFIGSFNRSTKLVVGEVLEAKNAKSYTVVSIDVARNRDQNTKAVTVIPRQAALRSK